MDKDSVTPDGSGRVGPGRPSRQDRQARLSREIGSLAPKDPADQEYFDLLNALAHSSLADIPQTLITDEQIRAVLRGEDVLPTPAQRSASLRVNADVREFTRRDRGGFSWRRGPLAPKLLPSRTSSGGNL